MATYENYKELFLKRGIETEFTGYFGKSSNIKCKCLCGNKFVCSARQLPICKNCNNELETDDYYFDNDHEPKKLPEPKKPNKIYNFLNKIYQKIPIIDNNKFLLMGILLNN